MSVISVLVDADAVTCSDDQHISGVQQEQDQPKDTTLWHRDIYPPFDTLRNPPPLCSLHSNVQSSLFKIIGGSRS